MYLQNENCFHIHVPCKCRSCSYNNIIEEFAFILYSVNASLTSHTLRSYLMVCVD